MPSSKEDGAVQAAGSEVSLSNKPLRPAVFKAQTKEYYGPKIQVDLPPLSEQCKQHPYAGKPVFLGPNKQIYDVFYEPVASHISESIKSQIESTPFPDIFKYDHIEDYEEAVIEWRKNVRHALGVLRLPIPMGRCYPRPRLVFEKPNKKLQIDDEDDDSSVGSEGSGRSNRMTMLMRKTISFSSMANASLQDTTGSGSEDDSSLKREGDILLQSKKWAPLKPFNPPTRSKEDPWDSLLVPMEPEPSLYRTYEEYEAALRRWGAVCAQLSFIPPHPKQLSSLVSILPYKDRKTNTLLDLEESDNGRRGKVTDSNDALAADWRIRSGLTVVHIMKDPLYFSFPPPIPKEESEFKKTQKTAAIKLDQRNISSLPKHIQETLQTAFDRCLAKRQKQKSGFSAPFASSFNEPILPVLHGTLPKPFHSDGDRTVVDGISSKDALWRTGHGSSPELQRGYFLDCAAEVNGKKVQPSFYQYDLATLDVGGLLGTHGNTSESTIQKIKNDRRILETAQRLDHHNAWFWPIIPESVHKSYFDKVKALFTPVRGPDGKQRPLVVTTDHVRSAISDGILLDKFQELMSEHLPGGALPMSDSGEDFLTYIEGFLTCCCNTVEAFPHLMSLFSDSSSSLVHAKLAYFIAHAAQSQFALSIFTRIIQANDLHGLWMMAYAISFFDEVPIDLFPYHPTTFRLVKHLVGAKIESIIRAILFHYYISIINETCTRFSFEYIAIKGFIIQSKKELGTTLANRLQSESTVIFSQFFKYIGHRSPSISAFFLFALVHLLRCSSSNSFASSPHYENSFKDTLRSNQADLLNNIRKLAASKFLHVQFAARRLFTLLQGPDWFDYLYTKYTSTYLLEQDLTNVRSRGVPTLLSLLISEMVSRAVKNVDDSANNSNNPYHSHYNRLEYFFRMKEGSLFRNLFNRVAGVMDVDAAAYQSTEMLASLLADICKISWRIVKKNSLDDKDREAFMKQYNILTISPTEMVNTSTLLSKITSTNAASFAVRTHLLTCLMYLIRNRTVFEVVRKERAFFTNILTVCREGNNYIMNGKGYKLMYKVVKYYPNILVFLDTSKLLTNFFDLIGVDKNTPFITMNALHFLTSLFQLPEKEQKKRLAWSKPTTRGEKDIKSITKDVQALITSFIENHLFVKVHMVYKKLLQAEQPAAPYQDVIRFYCAVGTSPICSKLFKEIQKNTEYKEGVQQVVDQYRDVVF